VELVNDAVELADPALTVSDVNVPAPADSAPVSVRLDELVTAPVSAPPVSGRFPDAVPASVPVIIPAEKFPLASLETIVEAVFADVASVAIVTAPTPV